MKLEKEMKRWTLGLLVFATAMLLGCRSRVIQVALVNTSQQPVSAIIVEYPGATFGVNSLAPGKTYSYRIKPLETGPLKLQFTDAQGSIHTALWPSLHKNQEGTVEIRLTQESASVHPALR